MKVFLVFIISITAFASSIYYPIKKQISGRTEFIQILKDNKIETYDQLYEQYVGSGALDSGAAKAYGPLAKYRYLYSPRWGWIDLKHVSTAIHYTSKWYLSGHDVLDMGMGEELLQAAINKDSAFSYEDLVSNLLGVYFYAEYADETSRQDKTFLENFASYLEQLGFSDIPLDIAPNASEIPQDYTLKEFPRNTGYKPMFMKAKKSELTELDKNVKRYVSGYLIRMSYL